MTPHESLLTTIKSAVPRLQPYEIEALAVALEGAGYRKVVEQAEACLHGCTHVYPDICFDPECPMGLKGLE